MSEQVQGNDLSKLVARLLDPAFNFGRFSAESNPRAVLDGLKAALEDILDQIEWLDMDLAPREGEIIVCRFAHHAPRPAMFDGQAWTVWGAMTEGAPEPIGWRPLLGLPTRAAWRPMSTAPHDGTPLLLKVRPMAELPERASGLDGITFVGHHRGDSLEWSFAAPVGMGGIPDEWLVGWMPAPSGEATP